MNTDLLFRQIQDLKRTISTHEVSIAEIHNSIFLLEEALFDIEERKAALHKLEYEDAY